MNQRILRLAFQYDRGAITHHEMFQAIASLVHPNDVESDFVGLSDERLEEFREYLLAHDMSLRSTSHYKPTMEQITALKVHLGISEPIASR